MSTRQELYERIRASSKQEVIHEEMMRLGFWPRATPPPSLPPERQRRSDELTRQLQQLQTQYAQRHNLAALRRQALKQRLEASRARRQETKANRERERLERALAWQRFKAQDIVYLGPGVSAGLEDRGCDAAKLARFGLPWLHKAQAIAIAMDISVAELRFLSFARDVSHTSHYVRFAIPKKRGGVRLIAAPMPRLKRAQRWILDNLLVKIPLHDAAHGFVPQRSIVSNARPHVGADLVINLDLKDFFPSITFPRVKGAFQWMGYGEAPATILALLCTSAPTTTIEADGQRYEVATGPRHLPQGAPSSPALTNIICYHLDRRLAGLAASLGFTYTRYADDLTFSARGEAARGNVQAILASARRIITDEGLVVHPDKTRVLRRGRQQEVTGVIVNEKLNVDRATLRRFRATLRQVELDGPAGKTWGDHPDLLAAMAGYASFVFMVNPERGAPLLTRVHALQNRHPAPARPAASPDAPGAEAPSAPQSGKDAKKWWKLW